MGAPITDDSGDADERFTVIYKCVVFRKLPSTKADMVHIAKQNETLCGKLHNFSGQEWVRVSAADCQERRIVGMEAWVLVHGECVGLGDLLRPVHDDVEHIEELLWRMSCDRGDRVRPIAAALNAAGLRKASAFLEEARTRDDRQQLQEAIFDDALNRGCVLPADLVGKVKMAIEDSRLSFAGFPSAPPFTKTRILFTAPHSLPLCREGHEAHQPEAFTSRLAREFAQTVGGAYLTWAQHEEKRALEFYKQQGHPDPSNRDPNFTRREELLDSPWARNLREIKQLFGVGQPCLHVDLHGCKDPNPAGGSDLVVGFRANEIAGRVGVELLRSSLWLALSISLRGVSINVRPQKQLTGAALEDDFCTLSQQSLQEAGGAWTCAVQIEMSRSLRQELMRNKEARRLMAQAIAFAWTQAVGECADPPATLHALQYWLARCKAFYGKNGGTLLGGPPAGGEPSDGGADEEKELMEVSVDTTANSEARAPLPDVPVATLEADIIAAFRAIVKSEPSKQAGAGGNDANVPGHRSWRPSPVSMLRDWLRATPGEAADGPVVAPPQPEDRFAIVGSWNNFRPEDMFWDGAQFVFIVTIGHRGWECFQIRCEGDPERMLFPSVQAASPFVEHRLCGPGRDTQGKTWCIGLPKPPEGDRNIARPGQQYRVALVVLEMPVYSGIASPREVTWDLLGVRGVSDNGGGGAEALGSVGSSGVSSWQRAGGGVTGLLDRPKDSAKRQDPGSPTSSAGAAFAPPSRTDNAPAAIPPPPAAAAPQAAAAPPSSAVRMSELHVVVHIDRALALEVPLRLKSGATVAELKAAVAAMDPTGATKPEDFEVKLPAAAAEAPPLDTALVLTASHSELDLWTP